MQQHHLQSFPSLFFVSTRPTESRILGSAVIKNEAISFTFVFILMSP